MTTLKMVLKGSCEIDFQIFTTILETKKKVHYKHETKL